MTVNVTRALATFALRTENADVPASVREIVQALLIDTVGATYAGVLHHGAPLHAYAGEMGGTQDAILLGHGARVPAEVAAAVNAQVCQLSGWENTGPGLHPGPIIVHTALAVGQKIGASGTDVLTAIAIGYEVMCRFHHAYRGEPNVTQNNLVAALISARLLKLDIDQTANAISLALEFPARDIAFLRPKVPKRVSTIPMGFLFSARAGVQAAMLSQLGFASLHDELDHRGDIYDLQALTDWPTTFEMTARNVFMKALPAGHASHPVVQLAGELRDRHGIDPASITRIRAGVPAVYTMPHQNDASPETYVQAVVSVPWALSMQMHGIRPGPYWFAPETLADPGHRRLAAVVELVEHEPASRGLQEMRLDAIEEWIEITAGGQVITGKKVMAETWGSASRPMTEAMVSEKFLMLATPCLGADKAATALSQLTAMPLSAEIRALALHL